VLLHCIHPQSAALVRILAAALKDEGYRFERLDDVPAYHRYEKPDAHAVAWIPALTR
jgi:hypothetical protein